MKKVKKLIPSSLQTKVTAIYVEGKYDWEKQVLKDNTCKAFTSYQTCSGQFNFVDDNPTDNNGF